jgi:hypothetical protein
MLLGSFAPLAMGQASVQGQWSTLPYTMTINPIHAALLHNNKILIVAGSGNCPPNQAGCPTGPPYGPANGSGAVLLDLVAGTITPFSVTWDMFCNGMIVLPDGRAFINGGTINYSPFSGSLQSSIFDPATNTFTNVQNMAHGRWYPTVITLPSGQVMTFSGFDENGEITNTAVEIYTVNSGWSPQYTADWTPPLYPRLHVLPSGNVFYSGETNTTRLFIPSTQTWTTVADTVYGITRTYGSSVLLPLTPANNYDPRVFIMGGGNPGTATTELIDLGAATPAWTAGPNMSEPRIEMNATLLPNGKVLALGGSLNDEDTTTASYNADLYNPATNTFSSAGANAYPRLYHSVSLLLPDGTVWFAGGNPERGSYEDHMEIYQPAYLFNSDGTLATRPTISSAPGSISYGGSFTVQTPNAASISSVVLMRDGSVTHAFDMDQRMVGVSFTAGSGGLTVTAPPNANIAPPGYYMLFLLNSSGVPSVATFVQLSTSAAPSSSGINFVQANTGPSTIQAKNTSVPVAYTTAQTAGNLNIVAVGWGDTTSAISSITDSKGNTYTRAVGPTASTGLQQAIYYAKNIAAGSNTVSVNFNQAAAYPDVRILEYSGLDPTSPLDVTAAGTGNGTGASSGSATTTSANELIFGSGTTTGTTFTAAGSGFTTRVLNIYGNMAEDKTVSSAGSYAATATNSGGYWVMQMGAFKASASSSPPSAPTVTSISPTSGTANGGTAVNIIGTNFTSGANVSFAGTAATNVIAVSSSSITATAPPHTAGAVSVVVTNSTGQSGTLANGYTYTAGTTTVTAISPTSGTANGGTAVNITGTNFTSGATVSFGGTAATNVIVVSSSSITATAPAHTAGAVSVVVTNSSGQSGILANGYTYTVSGTISLVQANTGPSTIQAKNTSVSVAYTTAQTAGDLNIVAVGWGDTTSAISSVTDSKGNTYTRAVGPTANTGLQQAIYYAKSIAAGSNTVTVSFNQAAAYPDIRILEYKGLNPTSPLDVTAAGAGNGTSASSGSATTTSANELIFGSGTTTGTAFTAAGSGFTTRVLNIYGNMAEDKTVSSTGSNAAAATNSGGYWVMQMATFKP